MLQRLQTDNPMKNTPLDGCQPHSFHKELENAPVHQVSPIIIYRVSKIKQGNQACCFVCSTSQFQLLHNIGLEISIWVPRGVTEIKSNIKCVKHILPAQFAIRSWALSVEDDDEDTILQVLQCLRNGWDSVDPLPPIQVNFWWFLCHGNCDFHQVLKIWSFHPVIWIFWRILGIFYD